MKEQEYLNYLNQLLSGKTDFSHKPHDNTETSYLTNIKLQKQQGSNYLQAFNRQYPHHNITNNDTQIYQNKTTIQPHTISNEGLTEVIDNTKTSRNSHGLKFNPTKVRKRSEDKFSREPLSRRSSRGSTRRQKKSDLVEVRDKLADIIGFINAKIEGNPENVEIKKVVDLDYVKESLLPIQKQTPNREKKEDDNRELLYLPKFQLNDAKLVKSSEILNTNSPINHEKNKQDNQFLNLKHSFDKLNDIHSSNSLHEVIRADHQQRFRRQNNHIPLPQHHYRRDPQPPRNHVTYNSQPKPMIYINGHPQNQPRYSPVIRQVRPLSQVPVVRYVQHSQLNPNEPYSSNSLSKISIASRPSPPPYYLPIGQANRPTVRPHLLNWQKTPTFRTITSRPLSTQRLPSPVEPRIISQNPQIRMIKYPPPQPITTSNNNIRFNTQPIANSESRLKKKANPNQFFKEQNHKQEETPKKMLTEIDESNRQQQYRRMAQEDIQTIISPPKPYTNFSSNLDNPFKMSQTILSQSKKSSRFKAQILKSIAERSQQNQPSKYLQVSGRSSGRMMSSVHEVLPINDIPKLQKFVGSGSTKLKRKGIELSSSKKGYMSQYIRQS